jgi:riboflavin kinase/FMN adenylyltransferase
MDPVRFGEQPEMQAIDALALGVFDGVHRGHQKIFEELLHCGTPETVAVATFEPHPMRVIAPAHEPRRLMTLGQKIQSIRRVGVKHVLVWVFDLEMRNLSPEDFVAGLAKAFPRLRRIVVGHNWRFGLNASGDAQFLALLGKPRGWTIQIVDPVMDASGVRISSSRIRELIQAGDIEGAEGLIGGRYCLRGEVVHGAGRGKELGFPTLNMRFDHAQWPPLGVYAAVASVRAESYLCVVNIGVRPTIQSKGKKSDAIFEAHLIDYTGEAIYGEEVEFWGFRWIRSEVKFSSLQDLKEQIARDIAQARAIMVFQK